MLAFVQALIAPFNWICSLVLYLNQFMMTIIMLFIVVEQIKLGMQIIGIIA